MIKLDNFSNKDYRILIDWLIDEPCCGIFFESKFEFPLIPNRSHDHVQTRKVYKATEKNTGIVFGYGEIANINLLRKTAEIRRILIGKKEFRKKGYGKLIVSKLLEICFLELKLNSVVVFAIGKNGNEKFFECSGFTKKEVLHGGIVLYNKYYSIYKMEITTKEWLNFRI